MTIQLNRQWRLTNDQYFVEETKKTQIVLHHTVGGSAKSTFNYWQGNPDRIATAYLIERDGTIYEVFDPLYWAHHLGLKVAKNVVYNKASIGIEIASEGALRTGLELNKMGQMSKFNVDSLYAFDIDTPPFKNAKELCKVGDPSSVKNDQVWRGYSYWDQYSDLQVAAVYDLCNHLCNQFSIPREVSGTSEFNEGFYEFKGIITHSNVRTDKTDLHPMWNWNKLKQALTQ